MYPTCSRTRRMWSKLFIMHSLFSAIDLPGIGGQFVLNITRAGSPPQCKSIQSKYFRPDPHMVSITNFQYFLNYIMTSTSKNCIIDKCKNITTRITIKIRKIATKILSIPFEDVDKTPLSLKFNTLTGGLCLVTKYESIYIAIHFLESLFT